MDRNNVHLLEGNHEKWLWLWANDKICQDDAGRKVAEFELVTKPAIEDAGIKEVRSLYRRMGQCACCQYDGNIYLVTHGGCHCRPAP